MPNGRSNYLRYILGKWPAAIFACHCLQEFQRFHLRQNEVPLILANQQLEKAPFHIWRRRAWAKSDIGTGARFSLLWWSNGAPAQALDLPRRRSLPWLLQLFLRVQDIPMRKNDGPSPESSSSQLVFPMHSEANLKRTFWAEPPDAISNDGCYGIQNNG